MRGFSRVPWAWSSRPLWRMLWPKSSHDFITAGAAINGFSVMVIFFFPQVQTHGEAPSPIPPPGNAGVSPALSFLDVDVKDVDVKPALVGGDPSPHAGRGKGRRLFAPSTVLTILLAPCFAAPAQAAWPD